MKTMDQKLFEELFEELKKVKNKILLDNVKICKSIFTHENGNIDYCIGFNNGLKPFENNYQPVKINSCLNFSALLSFLRRNTIYFKANYKYVIANKPGWLGIEETKEAIFWDGKTFEAEIKSAKTFEKETDAINIKEQIKGERYIIAIPFYEN